MGWSIHHPVGLIHDTPSASYRGYTLFATTRGGKYAHLIDMNGDVVHRWHADEGIHYAYLLDNGNLLCRTMPPKDAGGVETIGGSSSAVLELDWDSNIVWAYRNDMLHHDFERLANGNTLLLMWERLPAEIAAEVRGGFAAEFGPGMLGDIVREVTPDGDTVSEWRSWEHLDVDTDIICPLEARREWTHGNCVNLTPDGDLLLSYRLISTVGIVDRASGAFTWKLGPAAGLNHQHHPTWLDNGRILIFDNGGHRSGISYSRVIEVDPKTDKIHWEYQGAPNISFYSYNISGAERLPNGNTLICEGAPGRMFEVTPRCEVVWEYINPFFVYGRSAGGEGREYSNATFRCHRYGPDHPALTERDLDPAQYANVNRLLW